MNEVLAILNHCHSLSGVLLLCSLYRDTATGLAGFGIGGGLWLISVFCPLMLSQQKGKKAPDTPTSASHIDNIRK